MPKNYIKKTHLNLNSAISLLKITKSQFKSIIFQLNIKPQKTSKIFKLNCNDLFVFSIKDINKIYNSEIYKILLQNKKVLKKKEKFNELKRFDLVNKNNFKKIDFVEIIKNKYSCFSDAVHDLGESLTFLYIFMHYVGSENKNLENNDSKNSDSKNNESENKNLENSDLENNNANLNFENIKNNINGNLDFENIHTENQNLKNIIKKELILFENLIKTKNFIKKIFPSKKGIHILLKIKEAEILFFDPLVSSNLKNILNLDFINYLNLYLCHLILVRTRLEEFEKEKEVKIENNFIVGETVYKKWINLILPENNNESMNDKANIRNINDLKNDQNIENNINNNSGKLICLTDHFIETKKENLIYIHPAFIFYIFNNQKIPNLNDFKISNFKLENIQICYPEKNEINFEKDFVETLSATKQRKIEDFYEEMKKETYFQ